MVVFGTELILLMIVVIKVPTFGARFTAGLTEPQHRLTKILVVLVTVELTVKINETALPTPTFTNLVVIGLVVVVCTVCFTPAPPITSRRTTTKTTAAVKTSSRIPEI